MGNDKKFQRKVIPIEILQNFKLPLLCPVYTDLPNPVDWKLYDGKQFLHNPPKFY